MLGTNSSAPAATPPTPDTPVSFTVHNVPAAATPPNRSGRLKMLLVLLVCAAPVLASYFTYYVIRPQGRTNYSQLMEPQRPMPVDLPLTNLQGQPVKPTSLKGQWLLVVVAGGACDASCEKLLYLQRQLRETLGKEKERLDKVWLIVDGVQPKLELQQTINPQGAAIQMLRVPREAVSAWLQAAPGENLESHFYVVDPMGNFMMRSPSNPEPAKLKRDIEKLLRASGSWDRSGRAQ
jgi:cytochrome oxidase Cu insertion factor (SCO1/SenC/PrrC family)